MNTDESGLEPDTLLDLLVRGREYFATHEWNRNGHFFGGVHFAPDTNICCPVGAVIAVAGFDNGGSFARDTGISPSDISAALRYGMTNDQKDNSGYFYAFNDEFAQSKDEVLAVFDRAIELHHSNKE